MISIQIWKERKPSLVTTVGTCDASWARSVDGNGAKGRDELGYEIAIGMTCGAYVGSRSDELLGDDDVRVLRKAWKTERLSV